MAGTDDGAAGLSLEAVTQGMVVTHRVFRREFPLISGLIGGVADGDTDRATLLAHHVRLVLDLVHVHHVAEEQFLWEVLPDRAPDERDIVDTMLRQHGEVAELADAIGDRLDRWASSPDEATGGALAAAIEAFRRALVDHADLEERATLPLITEQLTADEWRAFVAYASTAMPEDVRGTVMGMVLEDMPDAEREAFLGNLPAPVAERVRTVGAAAYAEYTAAVRAA